MYWPTDSFVFLTYWWTWWYHFGFESCLLYTFLTLSILLENVSRKVSFGNFGEIVSPLDFEFIVQTYTRYPYSFSSRIFLPGGGGTWKGKYESWKFCVNWESNMFWNCRLDSCQASIPFSNSDFSSIGCSKKEHLKLDFGQLGRLWVDHVLKLLLWLKHGFYVLF